MGSPNGVMMQFFHWYSPPGVIWNELAPRRPTLAAAGFTSVWIPPAYKGAGGRRDVGYGVYDLFDLGEFPQKQTIPTKYGTKAELLAAIRPRRPPASGSTRTWCSTTRMARTRPRRSGPRQVDWDDRNRPVSDWYPIQAWTDSISLAGATPTRA